MDATKQPYSRVLPKGGVTPLCFFPSSLMAAPHTREKERAKRIRKQKQKKDNHNGMVPVLPSNDSDYDDNPCP
jgi:hypothetical protein